MSWWLASSSCSFQPGIQESVFPTQNSPYKNLRLLLQMRFYVKLILVHKCQFLYKVKLATLSKMDAHTSFFPAFQHSWRFFFPLNMQCVVKFLLSKIMSMYLEAKNNNRNKNSIRIIFIVTNTYLVYFLHWDPKIVLSALLLW